jgi:hypothetical protein
MTLNQKYAHEAFAYDPQNGKLIWKVRPREHFATDSGWRKFNTRFSGKIAGSPDSKGYIRINVGGVIVRAHRIVWLMHNGDPALGEIDHINGETADNRIENLRLVSSWQNARNKRLPIRNTSGRVGVSWRADLNRWCASIGIGKNKKAVLGFFDTKEEAVAARIGAEKVLEYHPNHGR